MTVQPERTTSEFWATVNDCLTQFYGVPVSQAKSLIRDLRSQLLERGANIRSKHDVFYHYEPIDVASRLVDLPPPQDDQLFLKIYDEIVDRNRLARMQLSARRIPSAKTEGRLIRTKRFATVRVDNQLEIKRAQQRLKA